MKGLSNRGNLKLETKSQILILGDSGNYLGQIIGADYLEMIQAQP